MRDIKKSAVNVLYLCLLTRIEIFSPKISNDKPTNVIRLSNSWRINYSNIVHKIIFQKQASDCKTGSSVDEWIYIIWGSLICWSNGSKLAMRNRALIKLMAIFSDYKIYKIRLHGFAKFSTWSFQVSNCNLEYVIYDHYKLNWGGDLWRWWVAFGSHDES